MISQITVNLIAFKVFKGFAIAEATVRQDLSPFQWRFLIICKRVIDLLNHRLQQAMFLALAKGFGTDQRLRH